MGHIALQIVNINEVPNHTKRHHVGVNQNRVCMDKQTDMYYAPGVAHFAKITIIPSRQGTLDLRIHWYFYYPGVGWVLCPSQMLLHY